MDALERANGSVARAAEILEGHPNWLWKTLDRLGLYGLPMQIRAQREEDAAARLSLKPVARVPRRLPAA